MRSWGLVTALGLVVTGCTGPKLSFDKGAMLTDLAEQVLMPTLEEVAAEATSHRASVEALCVAPDATTLMAAQETWRAVRRPYKRSEAFAFGPIEDERYGANLDFWPVREESVLAVLDGSDPVNVDAVASMGSSTRGLPVLEFLLFDPEGGNEVILQELSGELGARRCAYLNGLAQDAERTAEALRQSWDSQGGGFVDEFARAGQGSEVFASQQLAISVLINQMVSLSESIKVMKIGKPAGNYSEGVPQPEEVESRYSDTALDDVLSNLDGLESLYLGRSGDRSGIGLSDFVQLQQPELDPRLKDDFQATREAVEAIEGPLRTAVDIQPEVVQAAYDQSKVLLRTLGLELTVAFGVVVTFTDNDGD